MSDLEISLLPAALLPPLPARQWCQRSGESCFGVCFVGAVVYFCVSIAQANGRDYPIRQTMVYCQAVLAVVCHLCILFCDPGSVTRTAETTAPVPPEVDRRLRENAALSDLGNIRQNDGTSYCVRCSLDRSAISAFQKKKNTNCPLISQDRQDTGKSCLNLLALFQQ